MIPFTLNTLHLFPCTNKLQYKIALQLWKTRMMMMMMMMMMWT